MKKAFISVLTVSLFLLASFAAMSSVQAENFGNDTLLGTLHINGETAEGDGWIPVPDENANYEYKYEEDIGRGTLTILPGTYSCKGTLIDCERTYLLLQINQDVAIDFNVEENMSAAITAEFITIQGNGALTITGLENNDFICPPPGGDGYLKIGTSIIASADGIESPELTLSLDGSIESKTVELNSGNVRFTGHRSYAIYSHDIYVNGGSLDINGYDRGINVNLVQRGGSVNIICDACLNGNVTLTDGVGSLYPFFSIKSNNSVDLGAVNVPEGMTLLGSDDGDNWNPIEGAKKLTQYVVAGKECQISAKPENPDMGDAEITVPETLPNGIFFFNETVSLVATPKEGYEFDHWDDGSTDNPRAVVVRGDRTYYAAFREIKDIVIDTDAGEADVNIPKFADSVTVKFTNARASIKIDISKVTELRGHAVHFALVEAVGFNDSEKYYVKVISDIPIDDMEMIITLPFNADEGMPTVYYYPDPTDFNKKIDMGATIDEADGTVSFLTDHNSLYGIEYSNPVPPEPEPIEHNGINILSVIGFVVAILVAIGLTFGRK